MNKYLKTNFRFYLAMFFRIIIIGCFSTYPLIISKLLDTIIAGTLTNIFYYISLCVVFGVFVGISVWFSHFTKAKFIKNTMFRIKSDLMKGIINKDIRDFQDDNSAKFISMLNADVGTLEEKYYNNIIAIFDSILTFTFAVILLIRINYIVAIISIALSSLTVIIHKIIYTTLRKSNY